MKNFSTVLHRVFWFFFLGSLFVSCSDRQNAPETGPKTSKNQSYSSDEFEKDLEALESVYQGIWTEEDGAIAGTPELLAQERKRFELASNKTAEFLAKYEKAMVNGVLISEYDKTLIESLQEAKRRIDLEILEQKNLELQLSAR